MYTKKLASLILTLLSILLLTSCDTLNKISSNTNASIDTSVTNTSTPPDDITPSDNIISTTSPPIEEDYKLKFVDVEGVEYETTILGSVPKHNYDFSFLDNSSNFYSYNDPNTGISAKLGIDVSKYQGNIDWQQVKSSGIEFVIIRLGFRGYGSSGSLNLDEKYLEYVKGASDVGLKIGVYFFSQAINSIEAIEEANYVLENIKDYNITGPIVFDTEEVKNVESSRTKGISGEIFTDCCIAFCDTIKNAGYQPIIYFNMLWQVFTLDITRLTNYEKWFADYEPKPQSPYKFSIWQYTESGNVPGINGKVDLNLWFEP